MSQPNQHHSSLTVSQNEDTQQKPKIDSHCSLQTSVTLVTQNESIESTIESKIEANKIKDETNETNKKIETELNDNETRSVGNDLDIINNEEVVATTDEHVLKCELAFNSQNEQLALINAPNQDDGASILIIDETRDQLADKSTNDDLNSSKEVGESAKNAELVVVTIADVNKEGLLTKLNSNLNELNVKKNDSNESCLKLSSNSNSQLNANLNQQQTAKSTKLSEDYLLNSSNVTTKETNSIVNSKPTLNTLDRLCAFNQLNSSLPNKRKIDSLQIVVSRKSPRLTESQSYHSDNSIYLFEPLRKRSSSISSANSTAFTDLARCSKDTKKTKENTHSIQALKQASASISSLPALKLSKRRCPNLEDPIMDDCTAALVLMSLSYSPKSVLLKDKFEKLIKKESSIEYQQPIKSTNRIAMLPKQRFKQEQRMLLNSDSVDKHQSNQKLKSTINIKRINSSSQSTEEGFDEEFTSLSDEEELLILQQQNKKQIGETVKSILIATQPTKLSLPNKMKCNTILKPVTRMVFQCTWRECGHESNVREQMEEHVRIQHLGITSCTEDHEEDFYYTEVELDSPLDSSGVSSAGQSPMHEPSTNNNSLSTSTNTSITTHFNNSQPTLKQARKRGPKPRQKQIIVESSNNNFNRFNSTVWMHMDMARPAHEDPEYKSRFSNNSSNDNNTTNTIKRERKRAASNEYDASDQSDFELNNQQKQNYLQNLTTEQLVKLQQQNHLHLKNNIQHLQKLQKQHQQLHQLQQLQQLHQQVKRKYTKSQQNVGNNNNSSSILMPATRTKSVICSMSQLENDLDHLLNSTNQNSPNLLKRSKPIKIPGISLAHRDYHQNPNQSSSFTVGSVQLSPTSYFHCFSPTPHSLSSPTSSNSSIYSLGSCNSPGSSSIASNSSSNGGSLNSYSPNSLNAGQQPILNSRSSAHYSPIDTLLQTVENERMAMEDEAIYLIKNGSTLNGIKKITKLKSANVSDLDLVAHNEDEDAFENKVQQQQKAIKRNLITSNNNENEEKKNELVNQTLLKPIKCSNNSQLVQNNDTKINKNSIKKSNSSSAVASSVIKNGQEALLDAAKHNLTVDCNLVVDNLTNNNINNNQNDLQTAQQALVTLASTATNLCNNIITIQSPNKISQSSRASNSNEKSNSIQNNSNLFDKNNLSIKTVNQPQTNNNGLLMAANILNQQHQLTVNEQSDQSTDNNQSAQAFNYLVSHSGRTIKPTPAAKSYVQRKNRLNTKYMRTQNSSNTRTNKKQNGISKHKANNLAQFERLLAIEAAQLNKNNENSADLNLMRNSIITSVGNLNSNNNLNNNQMTTNETQQQISLQSVQRTPTGRIRNSGAKCRKTYGMENKYQWCVQCRWKKACSRVDNSGLNNLTQYNNNNNQVRTASAERTRGRPANNNSSSTSSNKNSDQRRANVAQVSVTSSAASNQDQRNNLITNSTGSDFSTMAEEQLLRTGTLLNNQRTVVSAK